jgi:protein-S-isoprenylcysteine O-methyltransferase Ste14
METINKKQSVHKILAHSYYTFFLLFLIGIWMDLILPIRIFSNFIYSTLGLFLILFGSILIFWSQKTSKKLNIENVTKKTFCQGPYKYTRSPTHWGLFLLMFGFGIATNAFFVVFGAFLSIILSKTFFLRREEKVLSYKYGDPYLEYKKSRKF